MIKNLFLLALLSLSSFSSNLKGEIAQTSFISPAHPLLSMTIAEVPVNDILSAKTQTTIDLMYRVACEERKDSGKPIMVGMAAPQIGISQQIILVDVGVDTTRTLGALIAYINPKIVWASDECDISYEGCYSVDDHIVGVISRATSIKIVAYDRQGNRISEIFTGSAARIFQHEIDHLNGIRFPDRISKESDLHCVCGEDYAIYREHWQNWPLWYSRDKWEAMKSGLPFELPCKTATNKVNP